MLLETRLVVTTRVVGKKLLLVPSVRRVLFNTLRGIGQPSTTSYPAKMLREPDREPCSRSSKLRLTGQIHPSLVL